ncbi:MAG: hypothetical protein N2321_09300 [Melioribacteraceae bacterium]|nr:hypothetical protein [Melioribacteraceae bacterium]
MDDIIRIIVFLFFVWSIIGGLTSNKNKKKKTPAQRIPNNYRGKVNRPLPPTSKPPEEILEDLFGFKIPKSDEQYESYENKDLEKEVEDLESTKQTMTQWNIDYDKLTALEKEQKNLTVDVSDINYSQKKVSPTNEIVNKIKNKSSLKDAIIISEILNKPKALRR